jgi:hypothetical protein
MGMRRAAAQRMALLIDDKLLLSRIGLAIASCHRPYPTKD